MGLLSIPAAQVALDAQGQPVPSANLLINDAGLDNLTRIYADPQLTETLPNPLTADENGAFPPCYALAGTYGVRTISPRGLVLFEAESVAIVDSIGQSEVRSDEFESMDFLLADGTFTYAAGAVAGAIVTVRRGGYSFVIADEAATDHDIVTSGGLKLYAEPKLGEMTLAQFGGVEGVDVTAELQNLIDSSVFSNNPADLPSGGGVLMDLQIAKLTDTVHLGYGANEFDSVYLRGMGKKYDARLRFAGTVLTSSVFDSPAFAIQGARGTKIFDFSLHGNGKTALTDLFASSTAGNRTLLDKATWQSALTTAGMSVDRETAPVGGIVVDPYAGPQPTESYPAVTYPAFMGALGQYNKTTSSEVTISNVEIQGFEVGVVVQPNQDANGDFVQGTQMDISYATYAFSVGNTQARGTSWNRTRVSRVHTMVTNVQHGAKAGHFDGLWYDIDVFGFCTQLFELGEGWTGGTLTFQNLYAESLARLGTLSGQANIPSTPVVMRDCRVEFSSTASDQFICGALIAGDRKDRIVIENCNFRVPSVMALGTGAADLRDNFILNDAPAKAYQALASNCLSGGFVPDPLQNPEFTARLNLYSASTPGSNVVPTKTGLSFLHTDRDHCIPHALTSARHASQGAFSGKQMPVGYAEQARQTGISRTDRTITLTNTHHTLGDSDRAYRRAMLPGCVWVHRTTGTVLFVRSVDTATGLTHLEMQNNYYFDGSNWQILDTAFDPQTAEYYTFNGLVYAPGFALYGDVTAGSNTITNVSDFAGGAVLPNYGLTIGDRLGDGYYPYPLAVGSNKLEITGIDTTAQTITLNGTLAYTGRIPLPFWFRQPPANETSR